METPKFTGRNVLLPKSQKQPARASSLYALAFRNVSFNLDMPSNKKDPANTITSAQTKRYGRRPAILRI